MIANGYLGQFANGIPCALAVSATVSAPVDLEGLSLVGILIPSNFTGASITFQMSDTLAGVYSAVDLTALTVTAGKFLPIDPKNFYGLRFIKIVANTAQLTSVANFSLAARGL